MSHREPLHVLEKHLKAFYNPEETKIICIFNIFGF